MIQNEIDHIFPKAVLQKHLMKKYDKPNNRWYFDIERDGRLDLFRDSDFEKVLEQSYNASTER